MALDENVLEKGILNVTPSLQTVNTQAPQPSFLHSHTLKISLFVSLLPNPAVMAVLKVHGSPFSTATMRVVSALYEKGLQFEFVSIDMKVGQHKSEAFLALNPFGQVPAFEDGDLKLFESRAITQYIAHEYASNGTQLICPDSKKMAIMSVWMEVEAHQYDPHAAKLCFELCIKPMLGLTTDPAAVEDLEAKLGKVLDVYEARLTQSKYLGGDCLGLADLHHLPTLHYLLVISATQADTCGRESKSFLAELPSK
ncbi:hypothetical protein VitviT2T_009467 [Vitis vinifera]|uniref:glutathione transferase n=1 Tax=Vitis vinifera TaxID=29760 RepID=A0ABY9C4X7_VITVI|nr:hypothetical protein VitviT2T_009467 [Vitis vinifera]